MKGTVAVFSDHVTALFSSVRLGLLHSMEVVRTRAVHVLSDFATALSSWPRKGFPVRPPSIQGSGDLGLSGGALSRAPHSVDRRVLQCLSGLPQQG